MTKSKIEALSKQIIGAAINVHKEMGPGLLESVYEECMMLELKKMGLFAERQKRINLTYSNQNLNTYLTLDVIVEGAIILELKSVDKLIPIHKAQLLTYLRLSKAPKGYLINFNAETIKDNFHGYVSEFYSHLP